MPNLNKYRVGQRVKISHEIWGAWVGKIGRIVRIDELYIVVCIPNICEDVCCKPDELEIIDSQLMLFEI